MATRRSRIKAVANLPARRNRPVVSNDVTKENFDSGEANDIPTATEILPRLSFVKASEPTKNVKDDTLHQQSEFKDGSCAISCEDTQSAVTVNDETAPSNNIASTSATAVSENPSTSASESADVNSVCSSKRAPVRTRRSKPTVNLTAAARKRPANDSVVISPCSPIKVKCVELPLRKNSENDNNSDTPFAGGTPNQNVTSESKHMPEVEDSLTSLIPKGPAPATVASSPSSKTLGNTGGVFKAPATSPSKSKDATPSDTVNKGDGAMPVCPQKDSSNSKRKPSTNAQKVAAARKNLKSRITSDGTAPRSALTMFDLIFYNPLKNPMKSTVPSSNASRPRLSSVSSVSSVQESRLNEESVDDDLDFEQTNENPVEETAMPVPQVKVGPDGSLILDEQSLVIETTGAKKNREELEKSEVIVDTGSGYGHYKKIVRSKDWSDHETKKFYRALNVVGTDFSLMKPYFRNRTRRELKIKFKKEERFNTGLINKALGEPLDFDISELEKECELEDEEEKRLEELAKEKAAEKSKETLDNAEVDAKIVVKQKKKKKNIKRCASLAEIGIEAENRPATKKTRHRVIVPKKKKVTDADADYNMLALGVDLQHQKSTKANCKKTSEELNGLFQESKNAAENSTKKVHVKRVRRKPPPSDSNCSTPNTLSPCSGPASQEAALEVPSITSCIVSTSDVKVVQSTTQSPQTIIPTYGGKVVPSDPQSRIQFVQASPSTIVPTTDPAVVPASLRSPMQIVQASSPTIVPSTDLKLVPSTPQSRIQLVPLPSQALVPTTSPKEVSFCPQSQIQIVQTSPLSTPPLASIGASTPRFLNELKRPAMASQSSINSNSAYSPQATQMSILATPSNSTCVVPTSGMKLIQASPLPRTRTVPVTPHSTSALPGIGMTTPVSRLLPSTPPLPRMEPGSIIVLKTPLPQDPDRHVLQVYMVTNTPPGSSPSLLPHTPIVPGINLLSGPTVQPAILKSPCISDDSDCEKVLTKL